MSIRRAISALLLVTYLPACTSFQATTQPLSELTAPPKPADQLRITTADGKQLEVNAPRVANDTLYGSTWTTGPRGEPGTGSLAIPIAQIRTVEVRRSDGTKTAILLVGVAGAVAIFAVVGLNETEKTLEGAF